MKEIDPRQVNLLPQDDYRFNDMGKFMLHWVSPTGRILSHPPVEQESPPDLSGVPPQEIFKAWFELLNRVVDAAAQLDCIDDMEFPHEVENQDQERYQKARSALYETLNQLDYFERDVLDYDRRENG